MSSLVDAVNTAITTVFRLLVSPFGDSRAAALVAVSVVSGVLLLYVYGKVSNQSALKAVKRSIGADLLEAVLYRHDVRLCLAAQGRLFLDGCRYAGRAVPPLIVLAIPSLLILSQLNLRYENRGLRPAERALVKVRVEDAALLSSATLKTPTGVEVSPPLRIPETKEIVWRVAASGDQAVPLEISAGNATTHHLLKPAAAAEVSSSIYRSALAQLFYPGAPVLAAPFSRVEISYPRLEMRYFGREIHWLVVFFVVSLVSGLIAAKFLRIEI